MNATPTETKPQLPSVIHPGRLWWGRRIAIGGMLVTLLGTMVLGLNHHSSAPEMQLFESVRGVGLVVMFFGLVLILAAYPRTIPRWFAMWFSWLDSETAQLWLNALTTAGCLYVLALLAIMFAFVWPPMLYFSILAIIAFLAAGLCAVSPRDRYYLAATMMPYVILLLMVGGQLLRDFMGPYSYSGRYPGWGVFVHFLGNPLMVTLLGAPLLGFWGVLAGLWFERSSR